MYETLHDMGSFLRGLVVDKKTTMSRKQGGGTDSPRDPIEGKEKVSFEE
jgi:hypothetical protein